MGMVTQILRTLRSSWSLWLYSFLFNLTDVILFYNISKMDHTRYPYSPICLALSFAVLCVLVYDRVTKPILARSDGSRKTRVVRGLRPWIKGFKVLLWLYICAMCIVRVIIVSYRPLSDEFYTRSQRNGFIVVTIFAVVFDCGLLTIWWQSSIRTTHGLMAFASVVQALVGIVVCQVNVDLLKSTSRLNKLHNLYVYDGAFILASAVLGLVISALLTDKNRLTDVIGRLIFFFDITVLLVSALTLASLITVFPTLNSPDNSQPISNPILFGVAIAISLLTFTCSRFFRIRHPSADLQVVEYDVCNLTEVQSQGWAKVIDLNHKHNGGVSGDAVMSLMRAYCEANLEGMTCKVLRVYKKALQPEEEEPRDLEKGKKKKKKRGKGKQDVVKAWESMDNDGLLFQKDATDQESHLSDATTMLNEYKPLSKNQIKKLAKKQKNDKLLDQIEEIQAKSERFYNELTNTEALIMITIVENFDLTERIPSQFGGKFLAKHFGKDARWPLLVLRFGLLGFHWPFKRSTFYCSNTRKPVARSAAIMYALSQWNKSSEKCSILVDPTYKHDYTEAAIRISGWYKVGLPSTHIADLRAFKNKTLAQYFKAKKYRVQDKAFVEAGGEVIEINNPTFQDCQDIVDLNEMIGDARADNDQSDTLLHPSAQFVYDLCTISNDAKYRTLLFLKVNGKYIAACIIFRLGETMTMDINGIDYDADAKHYKAYFVLMQEVIRMALREKISFVDFGPTTENAKVDIGCSVVPLVGSLYTGMRGVGPLVKFAAGRVDV
ncbi:hypothetical protein DICA2_E09406 [Diutina catenulata]